MIHNKNMIRFCLSLLLFFSVCIFSSAYAYYEDDGSTRQMRSTLDNNNLNHYIKIGDTYYAPSGTSYSQNGNQINCSDGSSYTRYGNTIQNNSNAQTYQINNNLIQPIY